MRYYEIELPDKTGKFVTTNARSLKNLPDGTRCTVIITERDGTPIEFIDLPVENGRVRFIENKQKPRIYYG